MKKLKLNLEDLKIESFETSNAKSNAGTVVGQEVPSKIECPTNGENTCEITCDDQSCVGVSFCPECPPTQHHTCLEWVYTCGGQATCE